ncbi:MAG: Abi family protein [Enterovibrio sp.]
MPLYNKPALSTADHLALWRQRGLIIDDEERASQYLSHISYYRFSAYAIPYTQPCSQNHHFLTGTCFDDLRALYVFDKELRLLVLDAIERVEVSVRTLLCNHMSLNYGNDPFWYLDEKKFKREYAHKRLLASLERQLHDERRRLEKDLLQLEKRRNLSEEQRLILVKKTQQETFLRHYLSSYELPRLPPCWMMMELLSWGELSHLYDGLQKTDQKAIARGLHTHAELLLSWLKGINVVRNICAHHARLWNRELGVSIKLPTSSSTKWLKHEVVLSDPHIRWEKRLYPVLVALQSLLSTISPASCWSERLAALLAKYPHVSLAHMGMPHHWQQDPFWQQALQLRESS